MKIEPGDVDNEIVVVLGLENQVEHDAVMEIVDQRIPTPCRPAEGFHAGWRALKEEQIRSAETEELREQYQAELDADKAEFGDLYDLGWAQKPAQETDEQRGAAGPANPSLGFNEAEIQAAREELELAAARKKRWASPYELTLRGAAILVFSELAKHWLESRGKLRPKDPGQASSPAPQREAGLDPGTRMLRQLERALKDFLGLAGGRVGTEARARGKEKTLVLTRERTRVRLPGH